MATAAMGMEAAVMAAAVMGMAAAVVEEGTGEVETVVTIKEDIMALDTITVAVGPIISADIMAVVTIISAVIMAVVTIISAVIISEEGGGVFHNELFVSRSPIRSGK